MRCIMIFQKVKENAYLIHFSVYVDDGVHKTLDDS